MNVPIKPFREIKTKIISTENISQKIKKNEEKYFNKNFIPEPPKKYFKPLHVTDTTFMFRGFNIMGFNPMALNERHIIQIGRRRSGIISFIPSGPITGNNDEQNINSNTGTDDDLPDLVSDEQTSHIISDNEDNFREIEYVD